MSLTEICNVYCFVPTSHLIEEAKLEKLGDAPFKDGKSSNLWPGSYGDQEVSIKVLLRYESDDVMAIKVSAPDSQGGYRYLKCPPLAALVPRSRDLEADVPSKHPPAHRSHTIEGDQCRVPMGGKWECLGLPERESRGQSCEAGVLHKIPSRFLSDSCYSWKKASSAYNISMRWVLSIIVLKG